MTRVLWLGVALCAATASMVEAQVNLVPEIRDLAISTETFTATSGDVLDECIAPGTYKLLRFTTRANNLGESHLDIGRPEDHPEWFHFSDSHGHYHFEGFLNYTIHDMNGTQVKPGFKQAFCLMDSVQVVPNRPSNGYDCSYQGISSGWADIYHSGLPCQFIDITGVPNGDYVLRANMNPEQKLAENDFSDNVAVSNLRISGNTATAINLALGKAATGSAACSTSETPDKAVNGTVNGGGTDKFCTAVAPRWLQVDLGTSYNVSSLVVKHAGAGGESATWNTRDFDIQLSTDGVNFTTVDTVIGNAQGQTIHNIPTRLARYARLNITTPTQTTDGAARIYEFEVHGTSAGATPTARPTSTATATVTARPTATPTARPTATPTSTAAACATGATCEAETAARGGGVVVSTLHAGYTGSGFADYVSNGTGYVEWTVNVPSAGTYSLNFRYANGGTGDRPMSISVNGTVVNSSLSFPVTGWTTWTVRSLSAALPAGTVRIRATELPAGPNVDNLTVTGGSATPTVTARATATETARPTATPTARPSATPTSPAGACAIGATCEAETAALGGGVVTSAVHAGYTGTGFADYVSNGTGYVEWTVNVPSAGTYSLSFRYANGGTADRPMSISVNGTTVSSSLSFPVTGWTTWTVRTLSASLPAGTVKIRATELPAGPNVDNLTVTGGSATPTATATATPGSTSAWAPSVSYVANNLVTYNGVTYRCIQAHSSQVGWEPPNAPALWAVQ